MTVLLAGLHSTRLLGQATTPTILEVDIENFVEYQGDINDLSKFQTNPGIAPSAGIKTFIPTMNIGDIVAVNGQPAKGTFVGHPMALAMSPDPSPGRAIADTTRTSVGYRIFEILKADGTPIGTIMVLGLNGAPRGQISGQNFAIVGGTGAFRSARPAGWADKLHRRFPRAASILGSRNRRRNGEAESVVVGRDR